MIKINLLNFILLMVLFLVHYLALDKVTPEYKITNYTKPTMGRRCLSIIIDLSAGTIILFLLTPIRNIIFGLVLKRSELAMWHEEGKIYLTLYFLFLDIIFLIALYTNLHLEKRQSFGKSIMGIRLITIEGGYPSWGQLFIRNTISLFFFYIIALEKIFLSEKRSSIDILTHLILIEIDKQTIEAV